MRRGRRRRGRIGPAAWLVVVLAAWATPLAAQINSAGAWRTLESPRFRVHFRPGAEALAKRSAEEAERAHRLLSRELVPPRGKVDLVLSDAADFANAYASVFPSNRILVLVAPPTAEPGLQHYDDWLRLVIVHELTHIFHGDRVRGPWRLIQAIFGRVPGSFPAFYQPGWVAEGLATYYESRFTGAGRVRGSFHRQILLAAERGGDWLGPNETAFLFEKWPDGIAPYAFGSRLFERLADERGEAAVGRFVEATAGQWIPFRTGRPFRRATGASRDSLWAAMRAGVAALAAARPASTAETIERSLRAPPAPAVSDDGTLAYFAIRPERASEIVVRAPDGRERRHLSTAGVDLAWRRDTLYAVRLDFDDPLTFRSDLHRLVRGRWERVSRGARLTDLGAGETGVVAVQLVDGSNRLVRVGGDGLVPVADAQPSRELASPALSADGRLVVVEHGPDGYRLVQEVAHASGAAPAGAQRAVVVAAPPGVVLGEPAWSPDGQWLIWSSDETGLPQLYGRDRSGEIRRLTDEPTGAMAPALGADGWLYFATLEADGYALKRLRWAAALAHATRRIDGPLDASPTSEDAGAAPEEPTPPAGGTFRVAGYRPWPALRPHYFVPYGARKGAVGTFLGASTSGRDPLERTRYLLSAAIGLDRGWLDGELSVVHQRWAHAALDLRLAQEWSDAGSLPDGSMIWAREREAALGLTLGWRGWRRVLSVRGAVEYEQDRFGSETDSVRFATPEYAGASLAVAAGRAVVTPLGISNEDGVVASARFRRRWRLDEPGWSNEWRGRVTGYLGLGGIGAFAHPVLAVRVAGAWSEGPDRPSFGVGGVGGGSFEVAPGLVVGDPRDYPVRGYPGSTLRGNQVLVGSVELRMPVALVAEPLGDLPYGLDRVSLGVFYDYGTARRSGRSVGPGSLQSTGVEAVLDLGVSYDVSLRLRTFLATPLRSADATPRGRVAVGFGFGADF
ncbi:MAG TPA: hypothetical protein VNK43_08980 [Gemmatimonadales bacterium]|nr:hypothetical protein [Gemmatimonadales bacterium]